jgi:hypothetical protein
MTIDDAIRHPIFDKVRREEDFQFEGEGDMELNLPSEMSMEDIKERLSQEIKYYSCEQPID